MIPDPTLRAHALGKLAAERLNPEAGAVFSLAAPWRRKHAVIRLTVAFQVLYDYLDALGEEPVPDPLADNRHLQHALVEAVAPDVPSIGHYVHHPQSDDGGYVESLVSACREQLVAMPSYPEVAPAVIAAARRCAEGQVRTNVAATLGSEQLRDWVRTALPDDEYRWWEVAAGAAASLAVLAILAASADPRTSTSDAERIDAAYQPAICALTTLLDSLVDYARDAERHEHCYLAYYASRGEMTERVAAVADHSLRMARGLPLGARHAVLVAGIAAFYLSASEARASFVSPTAEQVRARLAPLVSIGLVVMRVRRWLRR
jgi:tetraprenyl-beta-curcumene synthase